MSEARDFMENHQFNDNVAHSLLDGDQEQTTNVTDEIDNGPNMKDLSDLNPGISNADRFDDINCEGETSDIPPLEANTHIEIDALIHNELFNIDNTVTSNKTPLAANTKIEPDALIQNELFNTNSTVTSDETPLEANMQIESDAQTQKDMFSINSTVTSDKADQFGNITNDFEIPPSRILSSQISDECSECIKWSKKKLSKIMVPDSTFLYVPLNVCI